MLQCEIGIEENTTPVDVTRGLKWWGNNCCMVGFSCICILKPKNLMCVRF